MNVLEFIANGALLGHQDAYSDRPGNLWRGFVSDEIHRIRPQCLCPWRKPEALRLSGANLSASLIATYVVAGLLAGIAGILVASRTASGHITSGLGWDFDAIAATIIGGTSFEEGKGGVAYTILGVILIAVLRNGLNVAGVPNMYQFALMGTVVLGAIIFDILVRRLSGAEESR